MSGRHKPHPPASFRHLLYRLAIEYVNLEDVLDQLRVLLRAAQAAREQRAGGQRDLHFLGPAEQV